MKTSGIWKFRSIAGKIMMGLILCAMIGSVDVAPALGDDDHKRMGKHDNGRYEQRGRGYDHERYKHGKRDYAPYGHRKRVYAPPPVVYEPPHPFGIGIFFPPIYIH